MHPSFVPYRVASAYIAKRLEEAGIEKPVVGIICGSGLSELSKALEGNTLTIKYSDIPGFPFETTVVGHKGEVVIGQLSGVTTICFRGRFHSYEGHPLKRVVLPVLVMRCINVKLVIITNAAGGLNRDFNIGDVFAISDSIALPQLCGVNSLMGPNDFELGPRFQPVSNAYADDLRNVAKRAAAALKFDFFHEEGTYCFVSGPMYESKAESKFLRQLGGDAVGMSTIPEVVAAHHSGMKVLGLSLITNKVVMPGDVGPAASHEEVIEEVNKRSLQMQTFVKKILEILKTDVLPELPALKPINLDVPKPSTFEKIPVQFVMMGVAAVAIGYLIGKARTA